jgi:hypothetical protein
MNEDAIVPGDDVVLGFNGAWGFAPADLTSPALAGAAGALVDVTLVGAPGSEGSDTAQPVTELRVHGVSGSDGPTMLEHPAALQVAGDKVTGFYRRWSPDGPGRPSVPWQLEAYSWGGLTEAPLASAAWLLLAPFMFYNVAHFALPPAGSAGDDAALATTGPVPHLATTRGHRVASCLLRLLALAATIQFVAGAAVVTVSTVAWQAAGRSGMLPIWMGWYGRWTAGWRVALAMVAVAGVVAGLWWLSVATGRKYEGRTTKAQQELNARWPLTQPGFWKGELLVGRQRALHAAAALAALAMIGAMSADPSSGARWVAIFFGAAVLAAAAASIGAPIAERQTVSLVNGGGSQRNMAGRWCRWVLGAAIAALATAAIVSGLTDTIRGPQPTTLPGLTTFAGVLLAVQAFLLIALTSTVAVLAARVRPKRDDRRRSQDLPYLGGMLGALFPTLGVLLGGMLTAVVSLGVTRLVGTPLPSGFRFGAMSPTAIEVPWPIYAFGAEPVGLLVGALAAAAVLWLAYRGNRRRFEAAEQGRPSMVASAYGAQGQQPAQDDVDDSPNYQKTRRAIAKAWAVGLVAEDAAAALAWVVICAALVVLAVAIGAAALAGSARHPAPLDGWLQGVASLITLLGAFLTGWFLSRLRRAYSNVASRKNVGMLWDVFTFWPRAIHPLAPPCYAERAVPELVDRISLLTGHGSSHVDDAVDIRAAAEQADLQRTRGLTVPAGQVLLTGYSQGSVIVAAAIAQLPRQVREKVALLTLACPARRLHGRAFPAFFGAQQLGALADLLDTGPGQNERGRWKNLCRRSDYFGSWIFAEPEPRLTGDDLTTRVDQPCWDPVVMVPDADPTPPPIHRHAAWWPDPRTGELGAHLVTLLAGMRSEEPDAVATVASQTTSGADTRPV